MKLLRGDALMKPPFAKGGWGDLTALTIYADTTTSPLNAGNHASISWFAGLWQIT
jgi:hypothetical protein